MPGIDKATARVVALIVLLILTGAALHGYLPPLEHVSRHQEPDNPAALVPIVVLLGASVGVLAVAIIGRARNRRPTAGGIGTFPPGVGDATGRSGWRVLLIGLAVVSAWLLIVWLLTRFAGQCHLDSLTRGSDVGTDTPAVEAAPSPAGAAPHQNSGGGVFGYLAAAAVGVLMLIAAGTIASAGIRRDRPWLPGLADEHPESTAPGAGPESLARAAELGLAAIGEPSRDPRAAIIACYATMERELGRVPGAVPQDCDTPTEVLARAVKHHAVSADNASRLVNLFGEARFSPHLMTECHRADAVRILRLVLDEIRSPV